MMELGLLEEKKPKQAGVKRKKQPPSAPTRRSSRVKELPKVNYDDEDWEVEHFGKRRKVGVKTDREAKVVDVAPRKSPRELATIDYGLMDSNMDEEIFCYGCEQWVVPPCASCGDCGMQFVHTDQLNLEVVTSKIRAAGQGLINRGATIVQGTLIGPYTGKFVSFNQYKQEEKKGQESGYAWLLFDSETLHKPYGFIDPGSAPDSVSNKLAKANHPAKKNDQCLVGCQYQGKIYYRAIKDILQHQEVFVDYGPEYAAELGIDQSTYDTYTRPENHKTVAIPCLSCDKTFSSQHFLDIHLKSCRKKKSKPCATGDEQKAGGGKILCIVPTCGKLFSREDHMMTHYRSVHLGEKVPCSDPSCGKSFSQLGNMQRHFKTVHLEQKAFKCSTCGGVFSQAGHLKQHVEEVHLGLRPFTCEEADCGATFTRAAYLKRHILALHTAARVRHPCSYPGCSASFSRAEILKLHMMDHSGERPFPCPYESCSERFKAQWQVNKHFKYAKRHAGQRLASKFIDKYLLPFTCQVKGCVNRYETEVERDRHMQKLHTKD